MDRVARYSREHGAHEPPSASRDHSIETGAAHVRPKHAAALLRAQQSGLQAARLQVLQKPGGEQGTQSESGRFREVARCDDVTEKIGRAHV